MSLILIIPLMVVLVILTTFATIILFKGIFKRAIPESEEEMTETRMVDLSFLAPPHLRWLCVKTEDPTLLMGFLEMVNCSRCTCSRGLECVSQNGLFVSPSFHGWTLAFGPALPDVVESLEFLKSLSRQFGEVHYYISNRIINHYGWVKAQNGRILRAFEWAGKPLVSKGKPTKEEARIGLSVLNAINEDEMEWMKKETAAVPDEDTTYEVARQWSVDPCRLILEVGSTQKGILGEF